MKRALSFFLVIMLVFTVPSIIVAQATGNRLDTYRVTSVSAGFNFAVALLGDSGVWSWGYNEHGELGLGHKTMATQPTKIDLSGDFIAVSAGLYHSMALANDGRLFTWGHNGQGQLGLGWKKTENALVPQSVSLEVFDGKITAISAGYYHSMALTDKGLVYT